jgi:hypothetical protein
VFDTFVNTSNFGVQFSTGGTTGSISFRNTPTNSREILASAKYTSNAWYLTVIVNSNVTTAVTDVNWRINGVRQVISYSTASDVFTYTTTSTLLFNRWNFTPSSVFGEVLWFNRALSDYEVDLVECWLARKWGNAQSWTTSNNLFRGITL